MSSKLIVKRKINAPIHKVFEAWSKPEIMEMWFYPPKKDWKARASNEFKVGGHYRLEMLGKDGTLFTHTGEYKEIILNKKIVFTWNSDSVSNTLVTVEFQQIDHQTEISLTHDLFPTPEVRLRHQIGWEGCLENMNHYFCGKKPSAYSFRCDVHFDSPLQEVYAAITTEYGLQNWWTKDCSANSMVIGSQSIFRFGKTYNVMETKEMIPNQKVVWECKKQHMSEPGLPETDNGEWVGTRLIFQLVKNAKKGTDLHFIHEGLIAELNCFNHCQKRWSYYLQESLRNYLEKGSGMPFES